MNNKKIILLGDSITEAFQVEKYLPEYGIINKGIYGDNTTGVLNRLQTDVVVENPDILFVLIGTNDFALERNDDDILSNMKEIVHYVKNNSPSTEINFTSILPTLNIENRPIPRIINFNQKLNKLCEEEKIKYFDLFSEMADDKNNLIQEFTVDGLHLSDAAYAHWAGVLKNKLN